ncbi:protein PUTATIVE RECOMBINATION INITIATION DEFECT 1 isoform X2 [Salvia miltiorrhiza]|uniref:protein PUTATIVE RECOMBINATION INITIATION DEFECT 1 isoform X2 n=1 Tax=Salvia miltiorrhiza TaxID=226208 RepID=UPI0025AD2788|nr:protein PUTATIVE RECOMBINATION INITIATION DEFECT 1 isoform X2 [Salvia miltiorrhiza]
MYCSIATPPLQPALQTCTQGHRSVLILPTEEGGSICLLCLSDLLSNPKSPTIHVSYALSQLSQALDQPHFFRSLLTFHSHFLVSPLVAVLSNLDDEPIAKQSIDLIKILCDGSGNNCDGNQDLHREFVARVSDCLSSGSLAWSRRQLYMVHCFGVVLDNPDSNLYTCIKNKDALILNLVTGLQLSNDEIQGEIMFVLYRLSLLQYSHMDGCGADVLLSYCPKLFQVSLNILMKSQSDDVRLNCLAFLTVLVQRGFFQTACINHVEINSMHSFEAESLMQITKDVVNGPSLEILFAEAVKGPLLSSDTQVQIAALDLIYIYLSSEYVTLKECQALVEENIADYAFEILRLSGCEDSIVISSIQVLYLLSNAEEAFRHRLAIGFSALVPVLRYVAEIPYHPVQCQLQNLILKCVLHCPGVVSTCNVEEISTILAGMLKKCTSGEIGIHSETFTLSCSIFVTIMKCSSSRGSLSFAASIKDASRSAVSICFGDNHVNADQILHFLYLIKEAYAFGKQEEILVSSEVRLQIFIIDICKLQILPWFIKVINIMQEEDIALGVLEVFHSILLDSSVGVKDFAESLVLSSWFSELFGCLGLFPMEKMKQSVYVTFSSIVDVILGTDSGQPIRDAALHLPSDPTDLLFLLGQKSSHNPVLFCCQSAVLMILFADERLILSSLEQFILLNSGDFFCGASASVTVELLVNLYGFYRGFAKMCYQKPYSPEAERILFQLLEEKDWDSLSTKIHLTSLMWLFQQEKLCKFLYNQIFKFCRRNSSIDKNMVFDKDTKETVDLHVFAELIMSEGNFVALIFVCLLGDLVENSCQDYDIIPVLEACTQIIEMAPAASDQFCMHGIDGVLQNIYTFSSCSSPKIFVCTNQLVFIILKSVQSDSLSSNDTWVGITMKLINYLITAVEEDGWTEEGITILGILSLILHHSTKQALTEASKIIVLNVPLISTINSTIFEAYSKGHTLFDHDEGTKTGEVLIFVLLLLFFSMRSVRATLPDIIDLQILLAEGIVEPQSYLSIRCPDLCKIMHFGSAQVKMIASFCLLEMFMGLEDNAIRKPVDLKFREGYLLSISAVLEGLIFFGDIKVALNCSRCLSTLMAWEEHKIESLLPEKYRWCRLIVQELVMSLSAPTLTKSLMIHHKPASNVAVALLKHSRGSPWMTKVFDDSSIGNIIQNLSTTNLTIELVSLFRELLCSGHLNSTHIADLTRVFQACRNHAYMDEIEDGVTENQLEINVGANQDHIGRMRAFLIGLVSSRWHSDCERSQSRKKQLLEEIEMFSICLMEEEDAS